MKTTPFLILTALCLLIVIGSPQEKKNNPNAGPIRDDREAEESREPQDEFQITYQVESIHDEAVADIVWLKKAAATSLREGAAYFNVLDQNIEHRYVQREGKELPVIRGVIQLVNDPMNAEYDAQEITALNIDSR